MPVNCRPSPAPLAIFTNKFNGYLWLWAILDLVLAAAAFYAGYDILRGGSFGRVFGVVVAGISAIRWFFYLPAAPWIGIVMIAVDIIIIYALVGHGEFFNAESTPSRRAS